MRWIFRYNEQAAKYIGMILHKKMPDSQPWLHIAVKTMSKRNPWCGYAIYVWDTRKVVYEYRSNKNLFNTDMFLSERAHMQRAIDSRQALVGGRKDINEFFEFGDFDASHSDVFDGKYRIVETPLYKRKAKKAGIEGKLHTNFNKLSMLKPYEAIKIAKLQPSTLKSAEPICPIDTVYKFYEAGDIEQRNAFGVKCTVIKQTTGSWVFVLPGIQGEFVARKQGKYFDKTMNINDSDVITIKQYAQDIDDIDSMHERAKEMHNYRQLFITDEDAEVAQNARHMSDVEFYEWYTNK